MSEIKFIKRFDAVDTQKEIVGDSFKAFIQTIHDDPSGRGHVLTISAELGKESILDTLFEGGGIGKTKVLEHMYAFYSSSYDKFMPIPIIDMFDETTTFLIWAKIMTNLLSVLKVSEEESFILFPNSMKFLNGIKPNQDNIADDLSKKALKYFRLDVYTNKDKIAGFVQKSRPNILFIDAFEYVDNGIKSLLDEYNKGSLVNKDKDGIAEARIKRFQHYNFSLFEDLKNEAENGILDLLLDIGVSIVVSGRVIQGFKETEISTQCRVGFLQHNEIVEFIEKVVGITEKINNDLIYKELGVLTTNRPILVDVFFQLVNKIKKYEENEGLSNEALILKVIESETPSKDNFEEVIFSELYKKTDSILTSNVLYFMSIAQYGVSQNILMDYAGLDSEDYEFRQLMEELKNWTYTKKMLFQEQSQHIQTYIKDFLTNIGINITIEEFRLHDEMVDLIIKHYWSKEDELIQLEKKKFLSKIIRAYEKYYLGGEPNEQTRKRLREYLEYKLELAEVESLYPDDDLKGNSAFSNTISEIAFRYISAIDEFPDHAERILKKASFFFGNKLFTTDKARILILLIDHYLAISNFREAEKYIAAFENSFENNLEHSRLPKSKEIKPEWEALRAIFFAHKAQLNIWQGRIREFPNSNVEGGIEKTKESLQKSSRLAYRTGARATLAWTAHLWGWLYQRKGEFNESMNWHKKALNAAITSSQELIKKYDPAQNDFEIPYQLRQLSKIIGRTLGNMVFTHKESGEIEESLFISNLLLFFLSKQKNDSREEVRALIGNFLSNILWGASFENIEKTRGMLLKIGDYEDPNLQLSMAIVNGIYLYKKAEANIYSSYYLPNEFVNKVTKLPETNKNYLKESKRVLESNFKGLADEPPVKNHNYARACYQYGKTCLVSVENGEIMFDTARRSFENAKIISNEIGNKYLELEAIEALFTLSYLSNNVEDIAKYRTEFKRVFSTQLAQLEIIDGSRIFDDNIDLLINLNDIIYKDILAKFFTTEGNIIFNEAMLDENHRKLSSTWTDWIIKGGTAFSSYSKMLHYSYLHNENRYTISLNILYRRLEKIVEKDEIQLIANIKEIITNSNSAYLIKDTDFKDFSNLLWKIIELELKIDNNPISDEKELAFQLGEESGITDGISILDARGQFQKGLILVRSLLNHRLHNFGINYDNPSNFPFKKVALEAIAEGVAVASLNLCLSLLLNNKSDEIATVVNKFNQNEKLSRILSKKRYSALRAGLNIMQLTSKYRNQEFWTIERFLEGELSYFKQLTEDKKNEILQDFEENLHEIIDFCTDLENEGQIAQNHYYYLRLLSESCIKLGEFCMLFDTPFLEKRPDSFTEKLGKMFEKLIDPSNQVRHIWDNPLFYINQHKEDFGDNSAAVYLSYAYHLSKFTARETNDFRRTAYCLEAIGNIYYLKGKFASKVDGIPAMIKYLCLNEETKPEFDKIDEIRPFENDRLKDRYIAEKSFRYPIILAYMKIVEGDYIFSQLFEIDRASYEENAPISSTMTQFQGKLKLPTFKLREVYFGKTHTEACRMKIRKMFLHYIKSLNLFAITPYRTFAYKNMVLELERRLLLIPGDDHVLGYIEEDLNTIWLNFNYLKNREDTLERLITLIRVRRLALVMSITANSFDKITPQYSLTL